MADTVVVAADPTSLETAQSNVLASTRAQCDALNANLRALYLAAFGNWKVSVDAGRIDNTNPPQPPKSFIPVETIPVAGEDSEVMGRGWFFPEQQGPPVCSLPAIPESQLTPKPPLDGSVTVVGKQCGSSAFYGCPDADTNKPGAVKQFPFPDGTIHKFVLVGLPFGRLWEDQGFVS